MSKKIITIVGARPQFIKAATVSRELQKVGVNEQIIHTGQHFDDNMSDIFFRQMEIPKPAYNLDINSLSHGAMTGRMLEQLEIVFQKENPDMVIVYGDTNSTLAGALAAQKLHIPVAHVEAGLRSYNMNMPEETNRILTDRISSILFCPTDKAVQNLEQEGFKSIPTKIIKSGDVMQDAALFYKEKAKLFSTVINDFNLSNRSYILCTIHRQENTDDNNRLSQIIMALNELSKNYTIVLPLHPRTRKIIAEQKIKLDFSPIEPVGYFDMIELLQHCSFVVTDSGGLQKEAFFFGKFCLTTRDETEWVELVENGFNVIVGAIHNRIIEETHKIQNTTKNFNINLYGNGKASRLIAEEILKF
ncbi:MAG: UDP-N-acetylglucosamine 2-epimerase [Bacteroidetes bacterium GWC2_33_15]|nr:MAG: UDP-N-acetylglucosamine 2-epimerase [Bacteroidetes bacterium GWA2_33_15]OFX48959.1 MAG: UDP-N-acetylglucosamine 2-epimerase [Bacteroidetes bacterium GWC2_33_15]OFX64777.1 MAG: UDP-N-acetylglucosamine 2-epimerase [Bacteroidetes bacterium GWB2_32_14]OFX68479.1 MAG: UDP-N-acetylglucosamine 2-epimerase [Bacteroidetes bacterium GWD2_33_33]HAN19205.1 UDP-N-acetylglucosamine 2-epimerase (non-hydrolyzing) [Bacteroidales bacterium]